VGAGGVDRLTEATLKNGPRNALDLASRCHTRRFAKARPHR